MARLGCATTDSLGDWAVMGVAEPFGDLVLTEAAGEKDDDLPRRDVQQGREDARGLKWLPRLDSP